MRGAQICASSNAFHRCPANRERQRAEIPLKLLWGRQRSRNVQTTTIDVRNVKAVKKMIADQQFIEEVEAADRKRQQASAEPVKRRMV
jgi:hypothetical protein